MLANLHRTLWLCAMILASGLIGAAILYERPVEYPRMYGIFCAVIGAGLILVIENIALARQGRRAAKLQQQTLVEADKTIEIFRSGETP